MSLLKEDNINYSKIQKTKGLDKMKYIYSLRVKKTKEKEEKIIN